MRNKKVQRVLCFLLALLCCFSLTDVLAPMQAHALAVELGWLTWAIIAYMAACGITFTAAGGIEALERAVTDAVDTYTEVTEITWVDWVGLLEQGISLQSGGSNNNDDDGDGSPDPNETAFKFGSVAAAALAKFVEWLTQNGWVKGDSTDFTYTTTYLKEDYHVYVNGVEVVVTLPRIDTSVGYPYFAAGSTKAKYEILIEGIMFKPGDVITNSVNTNECVINSDGTIGGSSTTSFAQAYKEYSYSSTQIVGFTVGSYLDDQVRLLPVTEDGYVLFSNWTNSIRSLLAGDSIFTNVKSEATVTVPEEFTDISPSEAQVLTINFSEIFGDAAPETIEEATEAIKQTVIDTGTLPQPEFDILEVIEPEPVPTPALTPLPSPVITDVEDLGLPALAEALFNKFPFCIPNDIKRIVSIIGAEPTTPKWEVDLFETLGDRVPFAGDTTLSIDLTEYEDLGRISRWASVIGFCIFLILITKQVINW